MKVTQLWSLALALGACDAAPDAGSADAHLDAGADLDASVCVAPPGAPCDCAPATPGTDGHVTPSVPINQLVADPARCRVYGLSDAAVVVFDTRGKRQLGTVGLPPGPRHLSVAPDGSFIAVALGSDGIAVVDPSTLTVSQLIPTTADVERVAADRERIFYVTRDQWSQGRRVDLSTGADTQLRSNLCYECAIVLSRDGRSLFAATTRASTPEASRFGVAENAFGVLDWSGSLFVDWSPERAAVLSADETRLYFARTVVNANRLAVVLGTTPERILADTGPRGIAIGTGHVYNATTWQVVRAHPRSLQAAALTPDGEELWALETGGQVWFVSTSALGAP